jgi:hypothetical protein
VDIVVIAAVFQAPMFWLNAVAPENACEPSQTLSKSPNRISPEPRRSVRCITVHAGSSGPSACGAMLLVLDHRDAAQLRRLGGRKPGIAAVISLVRVIILEMSQARQKHAWPQALSAAADGTNTREMSEAHKQP